MCEFKIFDVQKLYYFNHYKFFLINWWKLLQKSRNPFIRRIWREKQFQRFFIKILPSIMKNYKKYLLSFHLLLNLNEMAPTIPGRRFCILIRLLRGLYFTVGIFLSWSVSCIRFHCLASICFHSSLISNQI